MIFHLPSDRRLAGVVLGYWMVEDLEGAHAGKPIDTCPFPGAVLSVNLGRPNALVGGPLAPKVALLGVQERSRSWLSWENTSFLMACVTPEGLVALFPDTGEATASHLVDMGALVGDRLPSALAADVSAAPDFQRAALAFDRWILGRLEAARPRPEAAVLALARRLIAAGASVDAAARAAGTNRRQLARWHARHFGVDPSRMGQLSRLQRSVRAVQDDGADGVFGFADQAHQIRTWKRALDVTPGAYRRKGGSALAAQFDHGGSELAFYF